MFHRITQTGRVIAVAAHRDWRTVRRTSRTLWRRMPSCFAIIGEAAMTRPMPKIRKATNRFTPSCAAASVLAPTRPSSNTSVAWISDWLTLVRISGQASDTIARISSRQGVGVVSRGACMARP